MEYNVTYEDLITFDEQTEESVGLKITGTAFKVGKIASKKVVIPRDALSDITQTLLGSPILTDHSHSVRDVVGRGKKSWAEGDLVKFSGQMLDDVIDDKIKKRLISKVSIGLHADEIQKQDIEGETWSILKGVKAREISLVVFPAIPSAQFEPSFEFFEVEADEDHPVDTQLTEIDFLAMEEYLVANGKIVMDRADFDAIQSELSEKSAEYERISKQFWMLSNCDESFIENTLDKIDTLTLDQIQFLWGVYQDMSRNNGAQGIAYNEEDSTSVFDMVKEEFGFFLPYLILKRSKRIKKASFYCS